MKKFVIICAGVAAAYYFYTQSAENAGAYADDGSPRTMLFTTEKCGRACDETRSFLKTRTTFEEHDAFDDGAGRDLYKSYGGTGYLPYVVMGKQRVTGHNPGSVISAIAAELGPEQVGARERKALLRNFNLNGEPRIVMYATSWCGYCAKARQFFAANGIDYIEYDIEKDNAARRDYDALLGSGTPLLYQGYTRISGFDERRIKQEFDL